MTKLPFQKIRQLCLLGGLLLLGSGVMAQSRTISGTVIDDKGETVPFASVSVLGSTTGVTTDLNGRFSLTVPQEATAIRVSFVGFKRLDVALDGRSNYDIRLESEMTNLKEVVVVGNMERRKESFTGAFNTVSGNELRQVGAQNVVQSLKSLDASFVVLENIAAGANPNALPNIEVRGQTSISFEEVDNIYRADPNQPLFILDGFETTLQKIVDLDPNRVASITILKDAASTAFYGSRAANGVVVVETVKAESGRFRVYYNGDFSVQIPNLGTYNMMNAEEKLEFERRSGRYVYSGYLWDMEGINAQENLNMQYNQRLAEVQRGVNSDWLSEPLRTAFINRQSVRVSGGTQELTMDVGISYRNAPGVMLGSKRDTWTGDLDLTYRKGNFTLINMLGLSGYTAVESPYGSFSDWVKINPYYRKTDSTGAVPRYLEVVTANNLAQTELYRVENPLYNALLNSKNESQNMDVNERLLARWAFRKDMRFEGQMQLQVGSVNAIKFIAPDDTRYDDKPANQKGHFTNTTYRNLNYTGSLMYVWNNTIGKHSYVLNTRGEVRHQGTNASTWEATGYPYGTNGNPAFAYNYVEGRPAYQNSVRRQANFLTSANYSYDNRYLFDATLRQDGSTVFGSDEKFTTFWSTGVGWNLHEEKFMQRHKFIDFLRLRATLGQTGNQNLDQVISTSVFTYLAAGNQFGTGVVVSQLGNPNVEWQKTTTANIALDLNMLDNRLVSKFDIYQKYTNPLIVSVDQALSTGVTTYPMSLGYLRYRGFEFDVMYALIRKRDISWRVKVMGAALTGEYGGFDEKLSGMDKLAQENKTLQRFRDGYSPKTLWAVRSLGIDPSTGWEVFLTKDGEPTFTYNSADEVAIGEGYPFLNGTFSSFFTYKQLTLTVVMRYSLGEKIFNTALFEKVENISMNQIAYNQDKRALYDRWYQPGDVTQFKGISLTDQTPISSRFIQTESYLAGESIGLQWYFARDSWIRHLRMERMTLNATINGTGGVFRLSNVRRERGTDYPEATTISLSVSAIF